MWLHERLLLPCGWIHQCLPASLSRLEKASSLQDGMEFSRFSSSKLTAFCCTHKASIHLDLAWCTGWTLGHLSRWPLSCLVTRGPARLPCPSEKTASCDRQWFCLPSLHTRVTGGHVLGAFSPCSPAPPSNPRDSESPSLSHPSFQSPGQFGLVSL